MARLGIDHNDIDNLSSEHKKRLVRLSIDPKTVTFRRVVDTNDRFLREITVGQGPQEKGRTRITGFDITVASEVRLECEIDGAALSLELKYGTESPYGLEDACILS